MGRPEPRFNDNDAIELIMRLCECPASKWDAGGDDSDHRSHGCFAQVVFDAIDAYGAGLTAEIARLRARVEELEHERSKPTTWMSTGEGQCEEHGIIVCGPCIDKAAYNRGIEAAAKAADHADEARAKAEAAGGGA